MDTRNTKKILLNGIEHKEVRIGGNVVWSGLVTWNKYNTVDEEHFNLGAISTTEKDYYFEDDTVYHKVDDNGNVIVRNISISSIRVGNKIVGEYIYKGQRYFFGVLITYIYANGDYDYYEIYPVSLRIVKVKSNFVGTVQAEEGTYPQSGVHTDGFWYELVV